MVTVFFPSLTFFHAHIMKHFPNFRRLLLPVLLLSSLAFTSCICDDDDDDDDPKPKETTTTTNK